MTLGILTIWQATNAVATLLATWAFGMAAPSLNKLLNVSAIVIGVAIASFGELKFDGLGFISMEMNHLLYCDECYELTPVISPSDRYRLRGSTTCHGSASA
jgi:drug/metabolite transporter (DMT)-like permease